MKNSSVDASSQFFNQLMAINSTIAVKTNQRYRFGGTQEFKEESRVRDVISIPRRFIVHRTQSRLLNGHVSMYRDVPYDQYSGTEFGGTAALI